MQTGRRQGCGSLVFHFFSPFDVPLWRGQVVNLAHGGNEYVTSRQKRKTYGRFLVRFFLRKSAFCAVFWDLRQNPVCKPHGINHLQTSQKRAVYMTRTIFRIAPFSAIFFAT
jgi:hypothetical protein